MLGYLLVESTASLQLRAGADEAARDLCSQRNQRLQLSPRLHPVVATPSVNLANMKLEEFL